MSTLRENWRIALLVTLVVLSSVALFVDGATAGGASGGEGVTNLQYGIQLDGGSRIRAPVVGQTAENVQLNGSDPQELQGAIADRLGLDRIDVGVRPEANAVEVYTDNVTAEAFASALRAEGYDVQASDVRDGVTAATYDEMVRVIDRKLQISALSGATVRTARRPTGETFVEIEAAGRDVEELRSIIDERGVVRVYAFYPEGGDYRREQVLTQGDFASIGNARQLNQNEYGVTVTITDEAAVPFQTAMQDAGFTRARTCQYNRENPNESTGRCLLATLNGRVVFDGGVRRDLAQSFRSGDFVNSPTFVMTTASREDARDLELSLKAGQPLPAPLDFEEGSTTSLEPALADRFKSNSLITGLLAVLAVSLVVALRYGDPRVAAPMVLTAMSEVVILLGFFAVVQFPLNLSHIAGLVAVIGTGVDDLIIIADEILQQEGVATGRVFQNRFRKAFWVIGAAAATTIIAMSPLTVLSLGDLTGFAIVTIIGVLVGVLVTRPAYGDILRHLVLSSEE